MIREGERLDDLEVNGLKLIQNPKLYCFTSDSVLLANTAKVKRKDKVLDLCSGSGIVGILIASKQGAKSVDLVEIQPEMANLAERNVKLNNLEDVVKVYEISVQEAADALGCEKYDVVVCNPPYQKAGTGKTAENEQIAVCKTELKLTFFELAEAVRKLLKFGGKFCFIHNAERTAELIAALHANSLQTKKITLVKPKASKEPDTVIIEAVKGGKCGVKFDFLTVFDEDGNYTDRVKKLYSKD